MAETEKERKRRHVAAGMHGLTPEQSDRCKEMQEEDLLRRGIDPAGKRLGVWPGAMGHPFDYKR
jgi:hypothetical protein